MLQIPKSTYTMSFIGGSTPAIVFKTKKEFFNRYVNPNAVDITRLEESVKKYLYTGPPYAEDKRGKFGFGRCASYELDNEEATIMVSLRGHQFADKIACTINVILSQLNSITHLEDDVVSNQSQLMELETVCSREQKGHGIWGYMNPIMKEWCLAQVDEDQSNTYIASASEAMQTAYKIIAPRGIHTYFKDNWCVISSDGRPALCCWGFGIISNLNDDQIDTMPTPTRISSDNIDAAYQGITIMAGWAALFAMAHRDIYVDT